MGSSSTSIAAATNLLRTQYIVMMCSSSISLVCSTCLATMIWKKKENRFSTPYKRYLFAICITDILQSSALLFGPLAVPRDASVDFFLAKGNVYSCTIDGIAFISGASGVPFYMVALCFSYLYKIKFNMSDKKFLEKYDRFIHGFVITYCAAMGTGVVLTKNIYATESGAFCYPHKPYPYGCDEDPDTFGQCTRNKQGLLISFLIVFVICLTCFICIIVSMTRLVKHVVYIGSFNKKRFRASFDLPSPAPVGSGVPSGPTSAFGDSSSRHDHTSRMGSSVDVNNSTDHQASTLTQSVHDIITFFKQSSKDEEEDQQAVSNVVMNFETKGQKKAKERERDITIQALLYMGSFLFVYIWPFVGAIVFLSGGLNSQGSYFANSIIGFTFYPLGGLFNIIVYTRQKWQIVRKKRECSRISAFFAVLRHGGELPDDCQNKTKKRGRIIRGGAGKDRKEKPSFVDRINRRLQKNGKKRRQKGALSIKKAADLTAKDEQQPPVDICMLNVFFQGLSIDSDEDAIQKASMLAFSSGESIDNEDQEGFGHLVESGLSMILEESRFLEVEDKALEDDPLFQSKLLIDDDIDDEGSERVHREY